MQISSVPPPPLITNALPQDVSAKVVPNLQAMAPLIADAVPPAPKSEKSNQPRDNSDKSKGGGKGKSERGDDNKDKRGGSVNIRV